MDAADFSLSARQALQLDALVVPPGGDRKVDPGLWSYLRRQALNHGVATVPAGASEVTVTLPVEMPRADYSVQCTIAVDAGTAAAMANSPVQIGADTRAVGSFKIKLLDATGGAVAVPAGEALDIFWGVRE